MSLLESLAEPVAALIFVLAQTLGGNIGAAVITLGILSRLLLLPLSLQWARRAVLRRRAMQAIRPQLDRVRRRFADKPEKAAAEMRRLFDRHGIEPLDLGAMKGALLQAPVFMLLWTAVRQTARADGRFLWVGDLARPDLLIAAVAAGLTGLGAAAAGIEGHGASTAIVLLPALLTLAMLWKSSALVGLYWASQSLVGVLQGRLIRRWTLDLDAAAHPDGAAA